jgi:thiol-disulfide isomerase/thioredoxin
MSPKIKTFFKNHGVTLILLALVTYIWFRPPASVTEENRPVDPWSVRLTDGRLLTSEELKGKVVLVNLWATWCPYCLKEMPVIEEFWQDNRSKGFEVIAISVDDPPEKVTQYMKDKGYQFMASTNDPSATAAFGRPPSIPTSFVLDKEGNIRYKIDGQVHYPRLEKLFNSLI